MKLHQAVEDTHDHEFGKEYLLHGLLDFMDMNIDIDSQLPNISTDEVSLFPETELEHDISDLSRDPISLQSPCDNLMELELDLEPDLSIYDNIREANMKQKRQVLPRRVSYRADKNEIDAVSSVVFEALPRTASAQARQKRIQSMISRRLGQYNKRKRGIESQGSNDSSRSVIVNEEETKHNTLMISSNEYPKSCYLDSVDEATVSRAVDMALYGHHMPSILDIDTVQTVLEPMHSTFSTEKAILIDDTHKKQSSSTRDTLKTTKTSRTKKSTQINGKSRSSKSSSSYNRKKASEFDAELPTGTNAETRKLRKLIRNRMSAKLHRERQRSAMDSLEKQVKDRDEKIATLEKEAVMVSVDQITMIWIV